MTCCEFFPVWQLVSFTKQYSDCGNGTKSGSGRDVMGGMRVLRYQLLGYSTLRIANCLSGKHGGSKAAVIVPQKLEIYASIFCAGCMFEKARVYCSGTNAAMKQKNGAKTFEIGAVTF